MRDMWASAPASVQQALVAAWSFPGALERGGQRELIWVAETQAGTPAVIAGGILMRLGGDTRGVGLAALHQSIREGVARDRVLAIAMAPLGEPSFRTLIEKLADDAEPIVRVAALEKLARDPKQRAAAQEKLGHLAVSQQPGSKEAQWAMARTGDARVTRLLLTQAKSPEEQERQQAMRALLALDDYARAAFFMADPDVSLRTRTACEILAASALW